MTGADDTPVRLLVIDENPESLSTTESILASEPYEVDVASSADEALRLMLRLDYACIVSDATMPKLDAPHLARMVRADPTLRDTPILFVTSGESAAPEMVEALGAGVYDFIVEPLNPPILRGKVRVLSLLRQKTRQAKRQQQLLETIVGNLVEGLAVIAKDGAVVYCNDRFSTCFGSTTRAEDRFAWFERLNPTDPETEQPIAADEIAPSRALREGKVIRQEVFLPGGGTRQARYLDLTAAPAGPPTGDSTHVLLLTHDVTDLKRQELKIQSKSRELESFAYIASHDLKAPLRHITAFAGILAEELTPACRTEPVSEALRIIRAGTVEMQQLIEGLLQISRIGRNPLRPTRLPMRAVVEEAWASVRCEDGGGEATLELHSELPEVYGDRDRLKQVMENLLANSLRFRSAERDLHISVATEDGGDRWRILISDNGIGIPAGQEIKVFQLFKRLHPKTRYEGSGIGLAVCKRILELHEGAISYKSDGCSGTTFTVELPKPGSPPTR